MAGKLKKALGLVDVFAISTGAMISSGFFLLPGIAASRAGPAVVIAYALSGLLVLPSLFSQAELATAMPRAGGTYFFISRSLGTMFGTIDGVGVWLALLLKTSIALIGLGVYLAAYVPVPPKAIAAAGCVIFMIVNLVGAKESGKLQLGMVAALLVTLVFFAVRGLPAVEPSRFRPFAPFGATGVLATTAFVFVSYIGLTKVASVAEEIRRPERNIPGGMLLALGAVVLLYVVGVYVVVGVLPAGTLHTSLTPVADAAGRMMGAKGIALMSAGAILAFATTANAGLLSASRYLFGMGRDHVISPRFAKLSKSGMPTLGIVMTGAVVLLIALAVDAERIAKLASTFQLVVFGLINTAVIVMRESRIKSYDPGFKSPLYPYMQILGIAVPVILIPQMGIMSSVFAAGMICVGAVWYNLYVRHHHRGGAGAVAHVAERVAQRLLSRDAHAMGLDRELREILKEKGLRRGDPFAEMVLHAEFIELEPRAGPEDVLRRGAALLAGQSRVPEAQIVDALLQRNRLGETPVEAGIALPHVLLDNVDGFYLVAARSVGGVSFPPATKDVHAFFILLGSRGDPSTHLRFLAEIARRAEDPGFLDYWVGAGSEAEMREALLAGGG